MSGTPFNGWWSAWRRRRSTGQIVRLWSFPSTAPNIKDEGTSFHYAPPGDGIVVNPKYRETFAQVLAAHNCTWTEGKVWTTDALYRETADKVRRRKEQGCVCVDMECSAVAALAQFRGKEFFQFFHGADSLDGEAWDRRGLGSRYDLTEKDKIALLALELAVRL